MKHGGICAQELAAHRIDPADVLDLSVSLNPYGPCEAVVRAAREASLDQYPDSACTASRKALARQLDVDPATVMLGHGATELLWSICAAFGRRRGTGTCAVVAEPAFGEVRAACEVLGLRVHAVRAGGEHGVTPDLAALLAAARGACFVYLCNPSTPDGALIPAETIADFARELRGASLVLDESFLSLSDGWADACVALPAHVIRVRSLTKDHALPGVRVGYVIAPANWVDAVEQARPPWTVSAAAQAVAACALEQHAFLAESRRRLRADRTALQQDLTALDLAPLPSAAPYLVFPCADAALLRRRLLVRHRVLVRDCTSFGLPGLVRIGVPRDADRVRLGAALAAERAGSTAAE